MRHLEPLIDALKDSPADAVTISRDEAYAAYADALGLTVAELTEAEKGSALMAHVMERLSGSIALDAP